MKKGKIFALAGLVTVLAGSGVMLTAFTGKAVSYSTDVAGYTGVSEEVEATGDVHGENSKTYYSAITAPVNYYDLSTGDEVKKGDKVVEYDDSDLITALDQAELNAKSAENTMNGQVQKSNSNQAKYNKPNQSVSKNSKQEYLRPLQAGQ